MGMEKNRELGQIITKLIAKENLAQEEAYEAFRMVLANEVSDM
jgi:anthranilate phosphoribosyltransferase